MTAQVDPITFEIVRHRLFRVVEEAVITLKNVSGSAITNEGHDLMVSLYTAERRAADGGRRLPASSELRLGGVQGHPSPLQRAHQRRGHVPPERSLHGGAAYVGRLYRVADPFRRRAGRLVGVLRPCQRHRGDEPRRLLSGRQGHLHRRVLVTGPAHHRSRPGLRRRPRYDPEHGPRAGAGRARLSLDDRLQQCGAPTPAGAVREIRHRCRDAGERHPDRAIRAAACARGCASCRTAAGSRASTWTSPAGRSRSAWP